MNKKFYIFIILFLSIILIAVYFSKFNKKNNSNKFNYNASKTSQNSIENIEKNETNEINETNLTNENNSNISDSTNNTVLNETEISKFSTKIYTKDSNRQNNINLTCSSLNNTYVENGETFSFCKTVGKSTSSKGYKKADVFQNGDVIQALGGGKCQVSSTLYNAVLKVDSLKVTERHQHSNTVPYVSKGKDAAVSYGTFDFKFVNNTGKKIKISASCDKNYVYIKIFKLE